MVYYSVVKFFFFFFPRLENELRFPARQFCCIKSLTQGKKYGMGFLIELMFCSKLKKRNELITKQGVEGVGTVT